MGDIDAIRRDQALRDLMLYAGVICAVVALTLAVWDIWDGRRRK